MQNIQDCFSYRNKFIAAVSNLIARETAQILARSSINIDMFNKLLESGERLPQRRFGRWLIAVSCCWLLALVLTITLRIWFDDTEPEDQMELRPLCDLPLPPLRLYSTEVLPFRSDSPQLYGSRYLILRLSPAENSVMGREYKFEPPLIEPLLPRDIVGGMESGKVAGVVTHCLIGSSCCCTVTGLPYPPPPPPLRPETPAPQMTHCGEGIVRSCVIKSAKPDYPLIAKEYRIQGDVRLSIVIDKNGFVKDVTVESGPNVLQRAAITAARRWQFSPTLLYRSLNINGAANYLPVEIVGTLTFHFRL